MFSAKWPNWPVSLEYNFGFNLVAMLRLSNNGRDLLLSPSHYYFKHPSELFDNFFLHWNQNACIINSSIDSIDGGKKKKKKWHLYWTSKITSICIYYSIREGLKNNKNIQKYIDIMAIVALYKFLIQPEALYEMLKEIRFVFSIDVAF